MQPEYRTQNIGGTANNPQPAANKKKDLPKRRTTDGLGTIEAFGGVVFEIDPPP
jgi:hypothetical protein